MDVRDKNSLEKSAEAELHDEDIGIHAYKQKKIMHFTMLYAQEM